MTDQTTITMSLEDPQDEKYNEYLLQCVQAMLSYADAGKLAVVDCLDDEGEIVPVMCAMLDEPKAVLPLAQIFAPGDEPSARLIPIAKLNEGPENG